MTIGDVRFIGLLAPSFIQGVLELRESLSHVGDVFLYHLGFHYGVCLARYLLRSMGLERGSLSMSDIAALVEFFSDYARVAGFAVIKPLHVDLKRGVLEFMMEGCWEAELHLRTAGRSDKPVCFLTRGNIAGVASYVLGTRLAADEVRCEAMGDPYCVVTLSPEPIGTSRPR